MQVFLGGLAIRAGNDACGSAGNCNECTTQSCIEAAGSTEDVECLDHAVSRLARLTEMGWLWICAVLCYGTALVLEIHSRDWLARHIQTRRATLTAPPVVSPTDGNDEQGGAAAASERYQFPPTRDEEGALAKAALLTRVAFVISATGGSGCYAALWLYNLALTALMGAVCDSNFWALLLFMIVGWMWLIGMLLTGVPLVGSA